MRPHVDAETMPGIFICHAIFYKIYIPIGGGTYSMCVVLWVTRCEMPTTAQVHLKDTLLHCASLAGWSGSPAFEAVPKAAKAIVAQLPQPP